MLVDSADAVTEPELMMSLTSHAARGIRHVVLAGDVHQGAARGHRSLLERYHEQGLTLNTHYRMVSTGSLFLNFFLAQKIKICVFDVNAFGY